MMIQVQFDREKAARLKDQVSDNQKFGKGHPIVPVHLQNGGRLPHVHDGHVYHRPFENGALLRADWRSTGFQTSAAADRSTSKSGLSPCGTSNDSRTRIPESKSTAKYVVSHRPITKIHKCNALPTRLSFKFCPCFDSATVGISKQK